MKCIIFQRFHQVFDLSPADNISNHLFPESLNDLRIIYRYIAFEKLASENAERQVNRIRNSIRSLDLFPEGHTTVD